jgi:hypothetical protein
LPSVFLTGETVSDTTIKLPRLCCRMGLEMVDGLTASDARQNFTLLTLPVVRNHNRNRLTNHLFCGVAKDALGTIIPACGNGIEVFADDCVVTGLNDSRDLAQPLIAIAKLSFDPLALGNIDAGRK